MFVLRFSYTSNILKLLILKAQTSCRYSATEVLRNLEGGIWQKSAPVSAETTVPHSPSSSWKFSGSRLVRMKHCASLFSMSMKRHKAVPFGCKDTKSFRTINTESEKSCMLLPKFHLNHLETIVFRIHDSRGSRRRCSLRRWLLSWCANVTGTGQWHQHQALQLTVDNFEKRYFFDCFARNNL